MVTLNGKRIAELAESIGWTIGKIEQDIAETNVCIISPSNNTIMDTNMKVEIGCDIYAYLEECPEEGGLSLGGKKDGDGFVLDAISVADLVTFVGLGVEQLGRTVKIG